MKRFFVFFIFYITSIILFAGNPGIKVFSLHNGVKVLLLKVKENPVIACTVVVKTGLKYENKKTNGISHLLEHLMFNGTEKRTQDELYRDFDTISCYNNASTSDHYTAYYIVSPEENFKEALEILSDMLFHSTIPDDKFEKEKGIVVEEIRKDRVSPVFYEEMAFRRVVFAGTPYAMKVIGTEKSVNSLKRKDVIEYYKRYYSPENMVILVAGDYEEKELTRWLEHYFGSVKPVKIEKKSFNLKWGKSFYEIKERRLPYSVFYYVIKGVRADSDGFPYQEAYSILLENRLRPLLMGFDPSFSVSTDYTDDYGLIKIRLKVKSRDEALKSKKIIQKQITKIDFITSQSVKAVKTSLKAESIFALERPHFFGMIESPFLAAGCNKILIYREINFNSLIAFAKKVKNFESISVFVEGGKNEMVR